MTGPAAPRRPRLRSVRGRIAIACAGLFLLLGGVLVGATYGLVSHAAVSSTGAQTRFHHRVQHAAGCPGVRKFFRASAARKRSCHQVQLSFAAGAADQSGLDRRDFLVVSLAGLAAGTLLAGGLGWGLSGRVLAPLRAITSAARAASQENLDQRLALSGPPDELKELADTFDSMLARLDAAFASQRRFVASASHELRTPLTEMRALIDVTLTEPGRQAGRVDPVLAGVRAAADRSEELIEALLTLARSDSGLSQAEVVDLPTAVEDAIDQARATTAARQITISASLRPAQVTGDRVLIERLVTNLVDNAVRHNIPGGWVQAATRSDTGLAELTITNSGEPIPPEQVSGLFEPFRRLAGRTGSGPGTGLGLSIVASVARAHGGQAQARAQAEGGLLVQITLPSAPRRPGGDDA
jgi:signal transduction histidine kinase